MEDVGLSPSQVIKFTEEYLVGNGICDKNFITSSVLFIIL